MYEIHVTETAGGYVMTRNNTSTHRYLGPEFLVEFSFLSCVQIQTLSGSFLTKEIYQHLFHARDMTSGEEIPVLTFDSPCDIFGHRTLKKAVSYTPNNAASALVHLQLPVAKRLLELAQRKRDTCPITAKEYVDGRTAALMCGHLFTANTLDHFPSITNRRKCPICHEYSLPTYV